MPVWAPRCHRELRRRQPHTLFWALRRSEPLEELGLSHILNAEGEKLQYILGTLPGLSGPPATVSDVLAATESVRSMLETAVQNQLFLKAKMQGALSASPMSGATGPTGPTGATGPAGGPTGATGATALPEPPDLRVPMALPAPPGPQGLQALPVPLAPLALPGPPALRAWPAPQVPRVPPALPAPPA